jgi:alpha-tubulin suppressor-like RCC1 family protein
MGTNLPPNIFFQDISLNLVSDSQFGTTLAINATGKRFLVGAAEQNVYSYDLLETDGFWHLSQTLVNPSSFSEIKDIALNAAGVRSVVGKYTMGFGFLQGIDDGFYHSLGLGNDGSLWAWGVNYYGQLGNGNTGTSSNVPVSVVSNYVSGTKWVGGGGGYYISFGLRNDGSLWAWGGNNVGQLGNGNNDDSNVPVRVKDSSSDVSGTKWLSSGGGFDHSLGLRDDGSLWAWGQNFTGQLGNGTSGPGSNRNVPVRVKDSSSDVSGTKWLSATVGTTSSHSFGLRDDGSLYAWGWNLYGQLGNGTSGNISNVPVRVISTDVSGTKWISGVLCTYVNSMGLRDDGSLYTWGRNNFGQLGNGNTGTSSNVPVRVKDSSSDVSGTKWVGGGGGNYHFIGLRDDGSLYAWGSNSYGQLGNGNNDDSNVPVRVKDSSSDVSGTKWVSGGGGGYQSFGLRDDGSLWMWGDNTYGQLGNGFSGADISSNVPVRVVIVGGNTEGSSLSVTTYNYNTPTNQWLNDISDQQIDATGTGLTVALNAAGTRLTVGAPGAAAGVGAVFLYDLSNNTNWVVRDTPDISSNLVDGGFGTTIAANASGTRLLVGAAKQKVYSYDLSGMDGLWHLSQTLVEPSPFAEIKDMVLNAAGDRGVVGKHNIIGFVQVVVGANHSFGLSDDGSLWAWGYNSYGQLGNNTLDSSSNVRVLVLSSNVSGTKWVGGGGGYYHSLGLRDDGSLWAWGWNGAGQLGNDTFDNSNIPVRVKDSSSDVSGTKWLSGGGGEYHSIGLRDDGSLWAWGGNLYGQLGNGTSGNSSNVPVRVVSNYVSGTKWVSGVGCGYEYSFGLRDDGSLWAWGRNTYGQLGNGTNDSSNVPLRVVSTDVSGTKWVSGEGGIYHSLGLRDDGSLYAWGSNSYGQLGNGTNDSSNVPVRVKDSIIDVSGTKWVGGGGGYYHSLGLRDDGSLWAWGLNNFGQLGNGTSGEGTSQNVPVRVVSTDVSGTKWTSCGGGGRYHSLGLRDDGSLYAWGYNTSGQLGNEINIDSNVPVRVVGVGNTVGSSLSVTTYNYNTPTNQWLNDISDQLIDASGTALSLALNAAGTRLAVGAPQAAAGKGSVFLYDLSSNNQWVRDYMPNISSNALAFGTAVALDTNGITLLVGAPLGGDGGHVYTYISPPNPILPIYKPACCPSPVYLPKVISGLNTQSMLYSTLVRSQNGQSRYIQNTNGNNATYITPIRNKF